MGRRFLVDSDVLVHAKIKLYSESEFHRFWRWLLEMYFYGTMASIDEVGKEIGRSNKVFAELVEKAGNDFFLETDRFASAAYKELSEKIIKKYGRPVFDEFSTGADLMLIAHAKERGYTVVTREKYKESPIEVKIPNVCEMSGVPCIHPDDMYYEENGEFHIKEW